ncbi:unnamed protein product, partial [Pylaiella littoralis]
VVRESRLEDSQEARLNVMRKLQTAHNIYISTRRRVEPHCGYSTALLRVGSGANHRQRHRNTGVVIGSPQNSLGRGFSKYWARVGT